MYFHCLFLYPILSLVGAFTRSCKYDLCATSSSPSPPSYSSRRYHHGIGLPKDIETAAQYAVRASSVSSEAFHRVGGQPILEGDRIDDNTEKEVECSVRVGGLVRGAP